MDQTNIMARAMKAYFRREEGTVSQPASGLSDVEEVNGRIYAVLRNTNSTLAVYRVTNSGGLRYLKRYPSSLR
jgi:hypothetical protein